MKKFLISVLMPVKNEEQFIQPAIDSVLNQSYKNFELIIIDDGSTDETINLVKSYDDSRIKLIESEGKGKNIAFNLGYNKSNGDFLCVFAGDDIMEPNSLEIRITPILNVNDSPIAVASKVRMISDIKKFNDVVTPKNKKLGALLGGTIMINKNLANKVFPLPEILPNEDKWIVQHINHFSKLIHVPEVTLNYRIHENNSSSRTNPFKLKTKAMHKRFIVYQLFLEKYRSNLTSSQARKLEALSAAETLRYQNDWLSIAFMSNLSVSNKARFLFHSTKQLYWLRIKLFNFFSGRQ